MIERQNGVLSPEFGQKPINIRFHHLEFFHAYARTYLQEFEGREPWRIDPKEDFDVGEFTQTFLESLMEAEVKAQAQAITNGVFTQKDAIYYEDVIGSNDDDQSRVTADRFRYLMSIFVYTQRNPEGYIKVGEEKDGICNACVVGKHCKESVPFFMRPLADKDFIVYSSMGRLSKIKRSGKYPYRNSVIKLNDGYLIKSRLLFDEGFYRDLRIAVKKDFVTLIDFPYWNSV